MKAVSRFEVIKKFGLAEHSINLQLRCDGFLWVSLVFDDKVVGSNKAISNPYFYGMNCGRRVKLPISHILSIGRFVRIGVCYSSLNYLYQSICSSKSPFAIFISFST